MARKVKEKLVEGNNDLKRALSFRDVFFLSFGGESPLLSLLTYGAVALSLGGYLAPIILLIGMLVVLVNGLVVHRLARRFTASGGYYTYAMHSLSERTGFQTGWMYLFYSMLFGSAYVIGAVYVINYVFGISPVITALAISVPAFIFLILGIRPSAKYAVFAGIAEIGVMGAFFLISTYLSHGTFYSPITYPSATNISGGRLALAVLFAMGIPSGYGAIAPISGEIKNAEKVVGRVAISVIVAGGAMAALFVYGLTNLLVSNGIDLRAASAGSGLVVINLVNTYFGSFGKYFVLILAIGAINDGVLAILSFSAAASRTIFRMGLDQALPGVFSKQRNGQPVVANLFAGLGGVLISTLMVVQFQPSTAFIALGTVAVLGGLFIHLAANFSLLRVGIRRARRKLFGGVRSLKTILYPFGEIALAISAVVITALDLVFSMFAAALFYVTFFLGWIVVGYLLSDVKEIVFRAPTTRAKGLLQKVRASDNPEWERISTMTALEIRSELPDVVVNIDDPLRIALKKCLELDAPASIVIDKDSRPSGTILLHDIISLSEGELKSYTVEDYATDQVATVRENELALNLAEVFRETGLPILAIVDNKGKFAGTVREREIIRRLASVQESLLSFKET
ncbi:MAG: amino acid permease [Nitrososphaerota archaeon]|nr:amino acid permease [Nitrososphaerota archaeon]